MALSLTKARKRRSDALRPRRPAHSYRDSKARKDRRIRRGRAPRMAPAVGKFFAVSMSGWHFVRRTEFLERRATRVSDTTLCGGGGPRFIRVASVRRVRPTRERARVESVEHLPRRICEKPTQSACDNLG